MCGIRISLGGVADLKIAFLGADHEVTGSLTLIELNNEKLLVDCGMEQGKDTFVNQQLSVDASQIDCVPRCGGRLKR